MSENLPDLTSRIVAAYVGRNIVPLAEMPTLIQTIYATMSTLGGAPIVAAERPTPAVSIRRSVTDEHIICLDCGQQMQMLKRHLATNHQMNPDQYREKWKLAPDYPLLARGYSQVRSNLAKKSGLGTRGKPVDPPAVPTPPPAPEQTRRRTSAAATRRPTTPAPATRGRASARKTGDDTRRAAHTE